MWGGGGGRRWQILLAGLYTLVVGGETSRNWSNRLMRLRVLAQFIAILIILAITLLRRALTIGSPKALEARPFFDVHTGQSAKTRKSP